MEKEKAYIKKDERGRYRFGLVSEFSVGGLRKGEVSWSLNSWKNKRTAIEKIKHDGIEIVDLTKER